ncbi:thiol-disulfide oxidoreductase DCC family protein [Paenibacillus hamazuiensis]|uniref:thiol-disulfide oxidoreductase DCC family protein n=1 Tax=Paenibacillus hamazuiensis TaxID=2936508 RepID=UPI002010BCCF|nr:thiol-disulfide oxidoreductase DCC family protein [Paenibacillus hamazuiensis]
MDELHKEPSIVLYDGVCGLCNGVVRFVIRRDTRKRFRFAALQSDSGRSLLRRFGLPAEALHSFVLIEDGRAYTKSTAALRLVLRLPGLWPLLYAGALVPRPLRDAAYDAVARNRYRWFGKHEACLMPRPEWKDRFIE